MTKKIPFTERYSLTADERETIAVVDSALSCNHCLQRSNGGEWTKLLLLLAGDIERNPGPGIGESDMPLWLQPRL